MGEIEEIGFRKWLKKEKSGHFFGLLFCDKIELLRFRQLRSGQVA